MRLISIFKICPQRNELTRGPPELVQHFILYAPGRVIKPNHINLGSNSVLPDVRRKSATCHLVDMVWLYHSPIPVGRRGVNLLVQKISACRHGLRGGEVGSGQHPVIMPHTIPNNLPPTSSFNFRQMITNKFWKLP